MANGYSSSCKGGSNCESKIILMKTGLPRKSQREILEDLLLYFIIRKYTLVSYIGGLSVRYK